MVLIEQMGRNERQERGAISWTRYSSRIMQRYQVLLMPQGGGVGQPDEWFTGQLSDCCLAAQNCRLSGRLTTIRSWPEVGRRRHSRR
jgi:hypothetical protein